MTSIVLLKPSALLLIQRANVNTTQCLGSCLIIRAGMGGLQLSVEGKINCYLKFGIASIEKGNCYLRDCQILAR